MTLTLTFKATHQVYANEEDVWDAMLNQTDVSVGQNKNKFRTHPSLSPFSLILEMLQVLCSSTAAPHQQQFSVAAVHSLGKSW